MDFQRYEERSVYETRQVDRSEAKFSLCKTSYRDVYRYLQIIKRDKARRSDQTVAGPIACLGVRNGREVDLFRVALSSDWFRRYLVSCSERKWHGFTPRIPIAEALGRSEVQKLSDESSIGVEINPAGHRSDVWIGSFDALPDEWDQKFGVVFSNAFDHAFDPSQTATSWLRILRPGGYIVFQFSEDQNSCPLEPVGSLSMDDFRRLFPGELVHYCLGGSARGYTEYILRSKT